MNSPSTDRIAELYAIRLSVDGTRQELHYLVNPTIPISAGATAIHNITDEIVRDKHKFRDLADEY